MSSILTSTRNTFDLRHGDKGSLAYLACISPSWLPVPSSSGPKYTHYSAHWVLRQFGFDQDIPSTFKDIVLSLPPLDIPRKEFLPPMIMLAIGGEYKNLLLTMLVLARLGKLPILVFLLLQYPTNTYPCLLLELFLLL